MLDPYWPLWLVLEMFQCPIYLQILQNVSNYEGLRFYTSPNLFCGFTSLKYDWCAFTKGSKEDPVWTKVTILPKRIMYFFKIIVNKEPNFLPLNFISRLCVWKREQWSPPKSGFSTGNSHVSSSISLPTLFSEATVSCNSLNVSFFTTLFSCKDCETLIPSACIKLKEIFNPQCAEVCG